MEIQLYDGRESIFFIKILTNEFLAPNIWLVTLELLWKCAYTLIRHYYCSMYFIKLQNRYLIVCTWDVLRSFHPIALNLLKSCSKPWDEYFWFKKIFFIKFFVRIENYAQNFDKNLLGCVLNQYYWYLTRCNLDRGVNSCGSVVN